MVSEKDLKILVVFTLVFIALVVVYLYIPHINYIAVGDPDHSLILNPKSELGEYLFTWREYNFGGGYGLISMGKQISVLLFYILQKIPEKISFLIFIFGLLLSSGYSFYKFILESIIQLNKCSKEVHRLAMISGLFYSLNLFSCITVARNLFLLIPYLLTPWILRYLFKYLTLRKEK